MQDYDELIGEIRGFSPGELDEFSDDYSQFLDEIQEQYGVMVHGMGPVAGPLETPEGLQDFEMDMTAGVIRAALDFSEDGEEFVDYLENGIMGQDENQDAAARSVVEQAFPEIL